jgi:hypothetical protein
MNRSQWCSSLLLVSFGAFGLVSATAESREQTLRFEKGKNNAIIHGVVGVKPKTYVFRAREEQKST